MASANNNNNSNSNDQPFGSAAGASSSEQSQNNDYQGFIAAAFRRSHTGAAAGDEEWVEDVGPKDPSGEQERREVLSNLFLHVKELVGKPQVHEDILTILREYPALASEKYTCSDENFGWWQSEATFMPISLMILAQADLDTVSELYNLYPESLSLHQFVGNLPLHIACSKAKTEIIDFLMSKCPSAMGEKNCDDQYPIHILMRRKFDHDKGEATTKHHLKLVKQALDYSPETAGMKDNTEKCPLEIAIEFQLDISIIRFLSERSMNLDSLSLGSVPNARWNCDLTLDENIVKVLAEILPLLKVRSMRFSPLHWTRLGFIHLMNLLETNSSIQELVLKLPRGILKNDFAAPESLQEMLENNRCIQNLTFLFSEVRGDDNAVLRAIMAGLAENRTVQSIFFENLDVDSQTLKLFSASEVLPCKVVLSQVNITPSADSNVQPDPAGSTSINLVESFTVSVHNPESFHLCLGYVSNMPRLKDLKVESWLTPVDRINISQLLLDKLQENVIESVILTGMSISYDRDALIDSLKTNTSLKVFECQSIQLEKLQMKRLADVLKTHNATLLRYCAFVSVLNLGSIRPEAQASQQLVEFWTRVNRCGRQKARNPDTSLLEFVNLIGAVQDDSDLFFDVSNITLDRLSIQCALLREAPGAWSSHTSNMRFELLEKRNNKRKFKKMSLRRISAGSPVLLALVMALAIMMTPTLGFQAVSPLISSSKRASKDHAAFMINFSGGDGNNRKAKDGKENPSSLASKEKERKPSARTEDPEKDDKKRSDNMEDEDDGFSSILQRMSQWPGVDESGDYTDEERSKMNATNTESRNPFLSPFASLLNFDEIITSVEQEKRADNKNMEKKEKLDEINAWGNFLSILKQNFGDPSNETMLVPQNLDTGPQNLADDIVKEASNRVESMVLAASTVVSPDVFSSIIKQARKALKFQDDLVEVATSVARDRGLDDTEAAERARNTTDFVADLVSTADSVLRFGYVKREEDAVIGDRKKRQKEAKEILEGSTSTSSGTLFEDVGSARAVSYAEFGPVINTLAEMGWLSGGIYENEIERPHELGHSIVAEGISENVYWMVTDSVESEDDFKERDNGANGADIPVRTFIIRGFDASDERVDREKLFTEICNLKARPFDEKYPDVLVHQGLFKLATKVYSDIKKYIDWSAPSQKIVFTGHSVGGTLSILITLMLARDRGADFVKKKVLRVFTFGSPPALKLSPDSKSKKRSKNAVDCELLSAFGLPTTMVYGSIQPWDPIPRLFSPIDGLYPLLDDIGPDGVTLYATGPPRTLRFVARALVEAWEGWPKFRDMITTAGPQDFQHVGVQHLILPEPVRYLTDRFVNVNVNVPEVDEIVRVSTKDLYYTLENIFPLDVFEISFLTSGIRGFVHHFFPAYDAPLVDYAQKVSRKRKARNEQEKRLGRIETPDREEKDSSWGEAERWLRNVVPSKEQRSP